MTNSGLLANQRSSYPVLLRHWSLVIVVAPGATKKTFRKFSAMTPPDRNDTCCRPKTCCHETRIRPLGVSERQTPEKLRPLDFSRTQTLNSMFFSNTITNYSPRAVCLSPGFSLVAASAQRGRGGGKVHCVMLSLFYDMVIIKVINNKSAAEFIFVRVRVTGRDPFNQTFGKFRSKTQSIGSVQPEKFRKNGSTF